MSIPRVAPDDVSVVERVSAAAAPIGRARRASTHARAVESEASALGARSPKPRGCALLRRAHAACDPAGGDARDPRCPRGDRPVGTSGATSSARLRASPERVRLGDAVSSAARLLPRRQVPVRRGGGAPRRRRAPASRARCRRRRTRRRSKPLRDEDRPPAKLTPRRPPPDRSRSTTLDHPPAELTPRRPPPDRPRSTTLDPRSADEAGSGSGGSSPTGAALW